MTALATLDAAELYTLLSLVNERILSADNAGIPRDHESSLFREGLVKKLMDVRQWQFDHRKKGHLPEVMVVSAEAE